MLDEIEDAVRRPDLFPQVSRGVRGDERSGITRTAVSPLIERKENGLGALKVSGHVDQLGIDRKMGQAHPHVKERLLGAAISFCCHTACSTF